MLRPHGIDDLNGRRNGSHSRERSAGLIDDPTSDSEGCDEGFPCHRASARALIRIASRTIDKMDALIESGSLPLMSRSSSAETSRPIRSRSSITRCDSMVSTCSSKLGSAVFNNAMHMVVPAEEAMHPMRAGAGCEVLRHARGVLRSEGVAGNMDENLITQLFFDSMPESMVRIDSIEQVMQPSALRRFLAKVSEERAAVEATFHGAKAEVAAQIVREGLDASIARRVPTA